MLSIRAANVADVRAIAQVDVETWRATYAGVLPDHMLVGLSERQRAGVWSRFITRRPGDTVAAVDERGTMLGFGSCGAQREPDLPYSGEVFTLYVLPDYQGQGVGRQLLLALFARLIRCGLYSAVVWVLAENPARFFYERVGGRAVARRRMDMAQNQVDAIAFAWTDLPDAIRNRGRAKSRTG
jgi:ribosomal protein S18 acetylase RimI-like enzyme